MALSIFPVTDVKLGSLTKRSAWTPRKRRQAFVGLFSGPAWTALILLSPAVTGWLAGALLVTSILSTLMSARQVFIQPSDKALAENPAVSRAALGSPSSGPDD